MTLGELPAEERGVILWEFPRKVPHGVQFLQLLQQLYGISNDPEEFSALAPWCPVFRVEG
ncbi:MAG: hypothetical protein JOZ19_14975 [Rubrobacter sp.]|nr:hypothetical protein [Rubrobacter sp.]